MGIRSEIEVCFERCEMGLSMGGDDDVCRIGMSPLIRGTPIVSFWLNTNLILSPCLSRAEKRATVVGAICAGGHAMRPMVLLQRKTVESELLIRGYYY